MLNKLLIYQNKYFDCRKKYLFLLFLNKYPVFPTPVMFQLDKRKERPGICFKSMFKIS